jgi:PEP-CTERM motif/Proprotein convertase P-domain
MKLANGPLIATLWVLTIAGPASAATITTAGSGGAIPEFGVGVAQFDINVGTSGFISDVTVRLTGLSHTRVGNLRVTISNTTTGAFADLVYRVGSLAGGAGDNSNYSGNYAFNDAFSGDIWAAAGAASGTNAIVAGGDYFATGLDGGLVSILSAFSGTDSAGVWRLTIADLVNNDTGSLTSWELELQTGSAPPPSTVPEPSSYILFGLGLGGLAALRRRR